MKKSVLTISMLIIISALLLGFIINPLDNGKVKNPLDETICFEHQSDKMSNSIEITFLSDNKVKGTMDVWIHTEDYENSSESTFEGEVVGDQIKVELTIEIEGNIEHESETWEYKNDVLIAGGDKYTKVVCKE